MGHKHPERCRKIRSGDVVREEVWKKKGEEEKTEGQRKGGRKDLGKAEYSERRTERDENGLVKENVRVSCSQAGRGCLKWLQHSP